MQSSDITHAVAQTLHSTRSRTVGKYRYARRRARSGLRALGSPLIERVHVGCRSKVYGIGNTRHMVLHTAQEPYHGMTAHLSHASRPREVQRSRHEHSRLQLTACSAPGGAPMRGCFAFLLFRDDDDDDDDGLCWHAPPAPA